MMSQGQSKRSKSQHYLNRRGEREDIVATWEKFKTGILHASHGKKNERSGGRLKKSKEEINEELVEGSDFLSKNPT